MGVVSKWGPIPLYVSDYYLIKDSEGYWWWENSSSGDIQKVFAHQNNSKQTVDALMLPWTKAGQEILINGEGEW